MHFSSSTDTSPISVVIPSQSGFSLPEIAPHTDRASGPAMSAGWAGTTSGINSLTGQRNSSISLLFLGCCWCSKQEDTCRERPEGNAKVDKISLNCLTLFFLLCLFVARGSTQAWHTQEARTNRYHSAILSQPVFVLSLEDSHTLHVLLLVRAVSGRCLFGTVRNFVLVID